MCQNKRHKFYIAMDKTAKFTLFYIVMDKTAEFT